LSFAPGASVQVLVQSFVTAALSAVLATSCDLGVPDMGERGWTISSVPSDGEADVARQTPLEIQLDRRILPRSVNDRSVQLRSGAVFPPAAVHYALLERRIRITLPEWAPMLPDTTYRLEIDGLIDLDGFAQPEAYSVYFTTGFELGAMPEPEPADIPRALALLRERCASSGCHAAPLPAADLDLGSARGIEETAIRASSELGLEGVAAHGAAGALWLPATRIIEVTAGIGDPARSYLMYKVLGDAHIVGERMPPTGPRLSADELVLLAAWIERGAPGSAP
jgi:Bacterial Ig-like domain